MALDPTVEGQALLAETRRRASAQLVFRRDALAEACPAALFIAGAAALWLVAPPHGIRWEQALSCMVVIVLAMRVQFQTPFGFTVATQLAFVPLVFVLPPALVGPAVVAAFVVSHLPDTIRGRMSWMKLLQGPGNSCFALGPAWVLALAGPAVHAAPWVLLAAFAAQLATDFVGSALYLTLARGASLWSQVRETWWVWTIDGALSIVGLVVAAEMEHVDIAVFAILPLTGLLAIFAREREGRLQGLLELGETYRGTALLLGDVVEADDTYTGLHSRGVVELAIVVGEALALTPEALRNLEFAALLHDVGKIAIPKQIINKPGKLTAEEWALMKTHAAEGQRMLDRIGGFMEEVGLIVRSHHERWDGGGYPDGLIADAAPLESRIITCCDSWSAMRTDRPYRKALSYAEAEREILENVGRQFDPAVAAALLRVVTRDGEADFGLGDVEPADPITARAQVALARDGDAAPVRPLPVA
jgi:HD-GYP domain-containing protein (c-di-GMP phosphodiesterase class II)